MEIELYRIDRLNWLIKFLNPILISLNKRPLSLAKRIEVRAAIMILKLISMNKQSKIQIKIRI